MLNAFPLGTCVSPSSRGSAVDNTGLDFLMTPPPFESHPASRPSPWSASTDERSYQVAALRAAVIAVVLLAILALLVLV